MTTEGENIAVETEEAEDIAVDTGEAEVSEIAKAQEASMRAVMARGDKIARIIETLQRSTGAYLQQAKEVVQQMKTSNKRKYGLLTTISDHLFNLMEAVGENQNMVNNLLLQRVGASEELIRLVIRTLTDRDPEFDNGLRDNSKILMKELKERRDKQAAEASSSKILEESIQSAKGANVISKPEILVP